MTAVLSQCLNFSNAIVKWGRQTGPGPVLSLECILSRNHFVTKSLAIPKKVSVCNEGS